MPEPPAPTPICPPLASPVRVPNEEAFVVPAAVAPEKAEQIAREAILGSIFRPYDIEQAGIEPTVLVHLPFWRIHASVDGFHLGVSTVTDQHGGIRWLLPTGGARHRDAVLLVVARRNFPFEPTRMQLPGMFGGTPFGASGFPSLSINMEETVSRASHRITSGEVIEPDVTRAAAEREAMDRILRSVRPLTALYSKYEPKVRSAALCHYPLYITRYGYDGHARRHTGEAFHVIVSGRSGEIVGAHHPSAARSLTRKFRRLIS